MLLSPNSVRHLERLEMGRAVEERGAGIGDRHHAADPQAPELPAGVLRGARQSRAACAPAPNPPRLSARATVVLPYA